MPRVTQAFLFFGEKFIGKFTEGLAGEQRLPFNASCLNWVATVEKYLAECCCNGARLRERNCVD